MSDNPLYCPSWEYKDFPGHESLIAERTKYALKQLVLAQPAARLEVCADTRAFHRDYFDGITPLSFEYYAGNYRGSKHPCLLFSRVGISGDPRVGHPPGTIHLEMASFGRLVKTAAQEIEQVKTASTRLLPNEEKIYRIVEISASIFVYFLEIHPYVNGNGHMARLMLICLLANSGILLSRWSIDPRPPDPPYSTAIAAYRNGQPDELIAFILSCI